MEPQGERLRTPNEWRENERKRFMNSTEIFSSQRGEGAKKDSVYFAPLRLCEENILAGIEQAGYL